MPAGHLVRIDRDSRIAAALVRMAEEYPAASDRDTNAMPSFSARERNVFSAQSQEIQQRIVHENRRAYQTRAH